MVEMSGFRNVLAHEYSKIKQERVYQHLQHLDWFRGFSIQMKSYLEDQNNQDRNEV